MVIEDDQFTRPGWDEYYLKIAEAISLRGDCRRSRVGAIIVDRNRIVVSTGYNGYDPGGRSCLLGECPRGLRSYEDLPGGSPYTSGEHPCDAVHAEDNALRFARRAGQNSRLVGATAYVTREPCSDCRELLRQSMVSSVYYPGGNYEFN